MTGLDQLATSYGVERAEPTAPVAEPRSGWSGSSIAAAFCVLAELQHALVRHVDPRGAHARALSYIGATANGGVSA